MFTEALEDILRDQCTPAVVRAIEAGADPVPLWTAVAGAGFLEVLSSEEDGGAGLPLDDCSRSSPRLAASLCRCRLRRAWPRAHCCRQVRHQRD